METKFSVMRQFGTEQFSMTITHDTVPSQKEIEESVSSLGAGITQAFIKVCERESSEKAILMGMAEKRAQDNKKLNDAIDSEMTEAKRGKILVRDVENLNRRKK